MKPLSSPREQEINRDGERQEKEGNCSSIKMQTAPAPLGGQTSGRGKERRSRRRRRINEEGKNEMGGQEKMGW